MAGDGRGGISYFAGGFSNQFGMETQIIAAICSFHYSLLHLWSTPTNLLRWDTIFRDHSTRLESTSNDGSEKAAGRCHGVGCGNVWHV